MTKKRIELIVDAAAEHLQEDEGIIVIICPKKIQRGENKVSLGGTLDLEDSLRVMASYVQRKVEEIRAK